MDALWGPESKFLMGLIYRSGKDEMGAIESVLAGRSTHFSIASVEPKLGEDQVGERVAQMRSAGIGYTKAAYVRCSSV
jgi:hypothetical protein